MRFGLFYEHQLPRPWSEGSEHKLLSDALDQIELADRLGFDSIWEVEHHFLEEYSHSSAPEVFLAAASQRTKNIRLGHGIVQAPPGVNHPARIAERVATLDLISGGRVEFGTGEGSAQAELGGFLLERERKHEMWQDAIGVIARMFVEEPFAGVESAHVSMPPRNVIPKPLQKPHPPMWVACSRRETIHVAARNGLGALSFSFAEPEDAKRWVDDYYGLIASSECIPAGFAVNPNLAVVLPMMCHEDEATAIDRGIDGAHFFGFSLAHFYGMEEHLTGVTDVYAEFQQRRADTGFAREVVTADDKPLNVKLMESGIGSMRGAVGTPHQVGELVRRYEEAGVDQVIFVLQAGKNKHEHICESIELFATEVMPEFAGRAEQHELEKAERLEGVLEAAIARREPPRKLSAPYAIDEKGELERLAPRRDTAAPSAPKGPLGERAKRTLRHARREVERTLRRQGEAAFGRLVSGKSDAELERRFGSAALQRLIFTGMVSQYQPDRALGFEGAIVYELRYTTNGAQPDRWTVSIKGRSAKARPGGAAEPALTLKVNLADFARIAAQEIDPMQPLIQGRLLLDGDLELAMRMGEMFGQESRF